MLNTGFSVPTVPAFMDASCGRSHLVASKICVLHGAGAFGLVWDLPISAHCFILPLICNCLPVFDENCRRSVNFMRACVSH